MFDFQKIFPAFLVAAIVAMLSGFVAEQVVHPKDLKKDAVEIESVTQVAAGGAAKPAGPEPIEALLAAADIERGAKLSKACAACHSFDKGGVNKVGPNLWDIVNAPKGGKAGFSYSSALAEAGGTWSYADLNKFLWKPKKAVPGTKMNFAGMKKPADRAAMVAWLRTLSDAPFALPDVGSAIGIEGADMSVVVE